MEVEVWQYLLCKFSLLRAFAVWEIKKNCFHLFTIFFQTKQSPPSNKWWFWASWSSGLDGRKSDEKIKAAKWGKPHQKIFKKKKWLFLILENKTFRQFHQRFTQAFLATKITKPNVTREKLPKRLMYEKGLHKTLVKLTPTVFYIPQNTKPIKQLSISIF